MHYSPIIAPVVALIFWKHVAWFSSMPALYRAFMNRRLTHEEFRTYINEKLPWNVTVQPLDFYFVCIFLAVMDAGRGVDCWLAWAFATCWVMQGLAEPRTKSTFTLGFRILAGLIAYALTLRAGIQITRDLLSAYS